MKKTISTQNAPAAIGPYSQAVEWNGMIFSSGIFHDNAFNDIGNIFA